MTQRRSKYTLMLDLPGVPPMNTASGMHWAVRKKHKDEWREKVYYESRGRLPEQPLQKAHVTITRCSSKKPDYDNLTQSGKFILDALKDFGVLFDDNTEVIGDPDYHWEPAKRGFPHMKIEVRETDSSPECFDDEPASGPPKRD